MSPPLSRTPALQLGLAHRGRRVARLQASGCSSAGGVSILDRAGVYRDRGGSIHLPLDAVIAVARAFAAAEQQTLVRYLDDDEELRPNCRGERWYHQYLRKRSVGC